MEVVVRTAMAEAEVLVERSAPDVTIGEVVTAIGGRAVSAITVDGRAVSVTAPFDAAGVRRGSVIEADPSSTGTVATSGATRIELVTIAGVGAGRRRELGPGVYLVGPGAGDRELADGVVADVRWRLEVPDDGIRQPHLVELDDRIVELRPPRGSRAADRRRSMPGPVDVDGTVAFNRPPRPVVAATDEPIVVPASTRRRDERRSFPVLAMIAPLPIAAVMAVMLGSWRYALFGLLSPVMVLANTVEDRRAQRRDRRRATSADRAAVRSVTAEIAARHRQAVHRARSAHPSLPEVVAWMHDAHPRLWERRPDHDDWLVVPVGWGDEPWQPPIERRRDSVDVQAALDAHRRLHGVPVTVDLRHGTGLGVVGSPPATRAMARAVVLAATALHGPADLSLVVCAGPDAAHAWEWIKWLPHARGERVRLFTDPTAAVDLPDADPGDRADRARPPRHVSLVVADGAEWWHGRRAPLRSALARPDVRLVGLVEQEALVPAVGTTVIGIPVTGRATIHHVPSATFDGGLAVDRIELDVALAAARRLARLDDPERASTLSTGASGIVRLLDELGLAALDRESIRGRWAAPDRRAAAVLGTDHTGAVVADLVADGPHALIAGTTGSGKSELLRTIVAGLAATLPPTELNVVMIDFKGGAAFDACARLPHTVGLVTDLDDHLAERMLRSLRAEVTSRERQLRAADVASLDDLIVRNGPAAMPRLLIVVDEFAALAGHVPSFVPGLIDIAQRGRSLGVHLVLATQRPAGVVDNKIRANTNLRIALRVHDDADSFDVIGTRDAAAIPRHQPGRAVARFGAGELVEFQTALVTAVAPPSTGTAVRVTAHVLARARSTLERRLDDEPRPRHPSEHGATDLDRLVDAIVDASGPVSPHRPCLDPLPALVRVHDLPDHARPEGPGVPLALVDRPDEQCWTVRTWRPDPGGSLGLIGATGSGTTSTLLALTLGLAATTSPDDVHLYGIDADAGRLATLARLPHVGAVVGPDDLTRVARLVRHLGGEIDRRRVQGPGAAPDGHTEPAIVLLVDNVASLQQALDGDRRWREVWPAIERVARDGQGVGITVVATASHERGIPAAIAVHLAQRLVLRLPDRSAYAAFGLRADHVPDLGPGRAIDPATGLEQQLLAPPSDLAGAVAAVADRWPRPAHPPRPIAPLPDRVTVAQLVGHARDDRDGWWLPIGLDRRDAEVLALPVRGGQVLAVHGPPGSGRTSALRTLLAGLGHHDPGVPRYAISPGAGLAELAIAPASPPEVATWVEVVLADRRRRVVVIDDADELDGPSLARLAAHRDRNLAVVLAGAADRLRDPTHWARPLLRARSGLLLAAAAGDGDLLGVSVAPASDTGAPGHGHAVVDGALIPVVVADGAATDRPPPWT